jgi:DNA-binding SARP family transcriptional activator
MRALQCLVMVSAGNGEPLLAIQHAAEMIELDPFKETAYQLLMKMHAAAGDRAEALRVFAKCRELLRDELGVSPSPQTEAVYLDILRAE